MTLPYVYRSVAALKRVIYPADSQLDPTYDADLEIVASAVGWALNEYTHRTFTPVTELRTFDAPAATHLDLPDLQASPTPTVTLGGVALVAGVDYALDPHSVTDLQPVYTAIIRLQGGFRRRWGYKHIVKQQLTSITVGRWGEYDYYPALDAPYGPYAPYAPSTSESQIAITGAWGYADRSGAIPAPLALAHEILTVRAWDMRTQHYAVAAAQLPQGIRKLVATLIDQDALLQLLLAPLVYAPSGEGSGN